MRNFPATFQAELSGSGCNPYWLLVIVANGTTYYLSDNTRTIASLGVTAYGAIKSWGGMREGSGNGTLAGYNVSEYTVQILAGLPIAANGTTIDILYEAGYLDEAQTDIYLGLAGISDPPQLINPGYVRDFGTKTDTVLPMIIQDKTILLESSYVGRKVTNTGYPQAATADIGKVIPIPFGAVSKVPAVLLSGGVATTLKTACTAAATSLYLSDLSRITVGMTLLLESEQVTVTAVGTYTVSATRAANSTTAAAHAKGVAVVQLADQIWGISDRAVTSLNKFWLRISDDLDLDVSGQVTGFTGQTGSVLTGYEGMAVARILAANLSTILTMAALALQDTIAVNDASHLHTVNNQNLTQYATGVNLVAESSSGMPVVVSNGLSFSGIPSGTFIQQTIHFSISFQGAKKIYCDGVLVYAGDSWTGTMDYDRTSTGSGSSTSVVVYGANNTYTRVKTTSCYRVVVYNAATTSNTTGVTKSGTVTLSGGDVSAYFGSGKMFVDVTADNGSPGGIATWILAQKGLPAIATIGSLTASTFSGLINEYQTCLYWLNKLAFEAGAWFMMPTGQPRFVSRSKGPIVATIREYIVGDDGVSTLTSTRTELDDKITLITVLYARDWSRSKSDSAYTGATSPAGSGTRERPDLFQMDFVADAAIAVALRNLYFELQQSRRPLRAFDAWIDQVRLESGDTIMLEFTGETGIVIPVEQAPGNYEQADTVKITVLI